MSSAAPLLLDTHFWIWLQERDRSQFSRRVATAIDKAAATGNLLVSVISVWEVGLLEAKGRIRLHIPCEEWVRQALATPGLTLASLTPEIALDSSRLPGQFHGDPADRIIVATVRRMGAKLVTRDEGILEYSYQRHISVVE